MAVPVLSLTMTVQSQRPPVPALPPHHAQQHFSLRQISCIVARYDVIDAIAAERQGFHHLREGLTFHRWEEEEVLQLPWYRTYPDPEIGTSFSLYVYWGAQRHLHCDDVQVAIAALVQCGLLLVPVSIGVAPLIISWERVVQGQAVCREDIPWGMVNYEVARNPLLISAEDVMDNVILHGPGQRGRRGLQSLVRHVTTLAHSTLAR